MRNQAIALISGLINAIAIGWASARTQARTKAVALLVTTIFVTAAMGLAWAEEMTAPGSEGTKEFGTTFKVKEIRKFDLKPFGPLDPKRDQRLIELGKALGKAGVGEINATTEEWSFRIKPNAAELENLLRAREVNTLQRMGQKTDSTAQKGFAAELEETNKIRQFFKANPEKLASLEVRLTLADAKGYPEMERLLVSKLAENPQLVKVRGMFRIESLPSDAAFKKAMRISKIRNILRGVRWGRAGLLMVAFGVAYYFYGNSEEVYQDGKIIRVPQRLLYDFTQKPDQPEGAPKSPVDLNQIAIDPNQQVGEPNKQPGDPGMIVLDTKDLDALDKLSDAELEGLMRLQKKENGGSMNSPGPVNLPNGGQQ
ncbi:MAG: hypothetical protein C5B49_01455 [Bdellovibrio sp.]|nr:MAG: hypothetical protein C5B49_01455 [Bdellovibrio sp.]